MQLDALPEATRDLFLYAGRCEELSPFTLIGGTALALQIGHRLSLDLDFAVFTERLPKAAIARWVTRLREEGIEVASITSPSAASTFRINTGNQLDDYAQDFEVAGVKVNFFVHGKHPAERCYYVEADRVESTKRSFSVLGIEALKVAKTLVLADRVRSRDLYDVMVLMRDHGLRIEDMVDTVQSLGHNNDFERYSAVMTGELPLDLEDEGLTGPNVRESMDEIYRYFGVHIDRWQIAQAHAEPRDGIAD